MDVPVLQLAPLAQPSPCPVSRLESELEQPFCKFDANGDGRILPTDVRSLLHCLGDDTSEEDALLMIKGADKNGDGFVDLREFIDLLTTMTTTKPPPFPPRDGDISHNRKAFGEEDKDEEEHELEDEEEQNLWGAFRLFDRDGNGLISPEELHEMLWRLGDKDVSLEQCRRMIYAVDRNQDGGVDFQEFKALMIPL